MRLLSIALIVLLTSSCTESTSDANSEFVSSFMSRFYIGQHWNGIREELLVGGVQDPELWNFCAEDFQIEITECNEGYNLIATIALPKEHWRLGDGQGQLYFNFDNQLKLRELYHEIYYSNLHN